MAAHEGWCDSRTPNDPGPCNCRERHEAHRVPVEPHASTLLEAYWTPGTPRPPLVQRYLKRHPAPE